MGLQEERMWHINPSDVIFSNPEEVLGSGAHGIIVKARYVKERFQKCKKCEHILSALHFLCHDKSHSMSSCHRLISGSAFVEDQ